MASQPSTALVTGAARGIGRETVRRFSEDDDFDAVALLDRDELVHEVAESMTGGDGYVVDVSDHDAVQKTVAKIERDARIDALVNNAAIASSYDLEDLRQEEWDRIIDVNLKGYYNVAKAVCPRMRDREYGRVVNISSGAGQKGSVSAGVHYSTSKGGDIGLTMGMAKQLSPHVNVNCVVPGLIDTFDEKERKDDNDVWTDEGFDRMRRMIPKQRLGNPDEVARVIHFLCGSGADYMTGSVVQVNGGADLAPTRSFVMGED